MRIDRLDLIRYGKFTDHTLDFGPGGDGRPDFHIVYGPNEAGKSTLFNAWLDLLYSIPNASEYNFRHSYDTMRIGARLNLGDGPVTLARIKKRTASLLDEADRPLPEALLQAALGGVDRDAYRTMFSLDDETLDKGGAAILESKGDLGQLLFSASSGLAALSQELSALRKKADDIHRPGARGATEIRDLRKQLDELTATRKELDVAASAYGRLVKERDRAATDYDAALGENAALKQRLGEIDALLGALPRLASLLRLRDELDPLEALREAPADWPDDVRRLRNEEAQLNERTRRNHADIEDLERRIEAVEIDEVALALAARIDDLADLAARHAAALSALPEERAQHEQAAARVAQILRKLEREEEDDPHHLILPAAGVAHLRELIETHAAITGDVTRAQGELTSAREAEQKARDAAADAGADTRDQEALAILKTQLAALQSESARISAEHRQADRTISALRERLDESFERLLPWQGDIDALARLKTPDAGTLRQWEETGTALRETISFQKEQVESQTQKRDRLTARRDALEKTAGLLDEAAAAQARTARDTAWETHLARLDAQSAKDFHTALEQDDALTATRLSQSADRAEHKRMSVDLAETEAALSGAQRALETAREEAATLRQEIAATLRRCDPALADFTLSTLGTWLSERDAALALRAELRQNERERQEAVEAQDDLRQRLAAAIERAGAETSLDMSLADLLERGQTLVDAEAHIVDARRRLETSQEETRRRAEALREAEAAQTHWSESWQAACAECWFAATPPPSPQIVRALLDELGTLAPALEARDGLARRIAAMEATEETFARQTSSLAGELGLSGHDDPRAPYRALTARTADARKAHETREGLRETLAEARRGARETHDALETLRRRKEEMTTHFEVETLDEVDKALDALKRREDLRRQGTDLEREILDALALEDMAAAQTRLEETDRAALELEKAETEQRLADQETRTRELYAEREKAAEAVSAIGGDAAVARLEEERRTILLQIEEKAKAWLRLKAGILAAEEALRTYRDNHRSSMMERASAAFRQISCGAYRDLVTQSNGDREELVGIDHTNASKRAGEMSKGTCFQLYLALRIAGYYEFVANRTSLPFIADDILETFDDGRAQETIRLLAEMSGKGQVIYLTHHPHLCAIARKVCPEATLHELPGPLEG